MTRKPAQSTRSFRRVVLSCLGALCVLYGLAFQLSALGRGEARRSAASQATDNPDDPQSAAADAVPRPAARASTRTPTLAAADARPAQPRSGAAPQAQPVSPGTEPGADDAEPTATDAQFESHVQQPQRIRAVLHERMAAEGRDPQWSDEAESDLRAKLADAGALDRLRSIECSASMCRVDLSADDSEKPLSAASEALGGAVVSHGEDGILHAYVLRTIGAAHAPPDAPAPPFGTADDES
jgi:hypothetical protein